jgi:phosphatidylcholine synthase
VIYTLVRDFDVGIPVKVGLCAIAAYIVGSDGAIRLLRSLKA